MKCAIHRSSARAARGSGGILGKTIRRDTRRRASGFRTLARKSDEDTRILKVCVLLGTSYPSRPTDERSIAVTARRDAQIIFFRLLVLSGRTFATWLAWLLGYTQQSGNRDNSARKAELAPSVADSLPLLTALVSLATAPAKGDRQ